MASSIFPVKTKVFGTQSVLAKLEVVARRTQEEVFMAGSRSFAIEIRNAMRRNARWTDRTKLARNTLDAEAQWQGSDIMIFAWGGAPWSIYLELGMGGEYAIIWPTLQERSNRWLNYISRAATRMGYSS